MFSFGALVFVVLAIVFLMVFTFFAVTTMFSSAKDNDSKAKALADALDGELTGYYERWLINFYRNHTQMRVAITPHGHTNKLRLSAPWPNHDLRIRLFPESAPDQIKRFLGMQDIIVGRKDFDDAFVIQSNDVEALRQLISQDVMTDILRIGKDITLSISGGVFTLEMLRSIDQHFLTLKAVRTFADIHSAMYEDCFATPLSPGVEVKFVEQQQATCMVCGETVIMEKVTCAKCKTVHHRDCWEYLGSCSTFACGSKRAR